jgi:hypothetical protein
LLILVERSIDAEESYGCWKQQVGLAMGDETAWVRLTEKISLLMALDTESYVL